MYIVITTSDARNYHHQRQCSSNHRCKKPPLLLTRALLTWWPRAESICAENFGSDFNFRPVAKSQKLNGYSEYGYDLEDITMLLKSFYKAFA